MVPETRIEHYDNLHEMRKGVARLQKDGWAVTNTQVVQQGWSFAKTCCLGVIFLPLALLGRKPEKYQVTYQRVRATAPAPTPAAEPIPISVYSTPNIAVSTIAPEPAVQVMPEIQETEPRTQPRIETTKLPIGCLLAAGIASIAIIVLGMSLCATVIYLGITATPVPTP